MIWPPAAGGCPPPPPPSCEWATASCRRRNGTTRRTRRGWATKNVPEDRRRLPFRAQFRALGAQDGRPARVGVAQAADA
jgi:hypothetical protein